MNVSVAIPTLNEEQNLPACLKALQPQMEAGDEVIIIDGGSEDSTVDIAKDAGCRVLVAEDTTIGMARSIGAKAAKNPIVATADADSLPPKGWLNRIKHHFEEDEELVVLWGNIKDKNGVPIRNLVGKASTIFRGASGNNTAFRKSEFDKLKGAYPDVNFMEDVAMINRLSKMGRAVRDENLVMVMNMDRKRYQTQPMMLGGLASMALGARFGGTIGDIAKGAGASLAGTEMFYEGFSGGPLHHDQLGAGMLLVGERMASRTFTGAGVGVIAHHVLTEGISALPSELEQNTDKVIEQIKKSRSE